VSGRKRCFKCGEEKWLHEFYAHPQMGDGHLGKCKNCTKKDVREGRAARRKQYSEYERARFQRPERKAAVKASLRRQQLRHPEKAAARTAVMTAIRNGSLIRQPCEVCGEPKAQAHHEDYSKPLEVRWLCFRHHREAHGQVVVAA
jgi:hypothetical protein